MVLYVPAKVGRRTSYPTHERRNRNVAYECNPRQHNAYSFHGLFEANTFGTSPTTL